MGIFVALKYWWNHVGCKHSEKASGFVQSQLLVFKPTQIVIIQSQCMIAVASENW